MSEDSKVVMMPVNEEAADEKPADAPPAAAEGAAGERDDARPGEHKDLTPQQLRAVLLLATGWRPA